MINPKISHSDKTFFNVSFRYYKKCWIIVYVFNIQFILKNWDSWFSMCRLAFSYANWPYDIFLELLWPDQCTWSFNKHHDPHQDDQESHECPQISHGGFWHCNPTCGTFLESLGHSVCRHHGHHQDDQEGWEGQEHPPCFLIPFLFCYY